jgi:uncharacterized protein DUF6092
MSQPISPGSSPLVLDESQALELLAFLITAARTQVDEASEYGSLRLLQAARRLGDAMRARASSATRDDLLAKLDPSLETLLPGADRDAYLARLDELCRAVADRLVAYFELDAPRASAKR